MKVVITGTAAGIGRAIAEYFVSQGGHEVIGIDWSESRIYSPCYRHWIADVSRKESLPDIENVDILINNAGVQNSGRDIEINLKGTINCTEKYGIHEGIKSILNIASVSAHNGAEFPEYCASKGGMLAYSVNTAKRVAKYGATCNSISPGGVITELNAPVMYNKEKWSKIMDETPLRRWATCEEIAEWAYFLTCKQSSMTGQDIIIDNGEMINHTFVW